MVQASFSIALVVLIFAAVVPKIASYSKVADILGRLSWLDLALLVAVTALNLVTYWPQMVAAMPGLSLAQAAVNNQTSTTIANTVPGGGGIAVGVSYAMFRSWGFSNEAIALLTLLTGVWNAFIKFGLPLIAVSLIALTGGAPASLIGASLVGLAALFVSVIALTLVLWKEEFARVIGHGLARLVSLARALFRKPAVEGWDDAAARFRERSIDLVRRRWPWLTVTTVVSHVSLYLVLLAALRAVGVNSSSVTWAEVLGVFALARLVSALPITPGGVGVVELSYIGGLIVAGADRPRAVAAVLVFRALTYGLQIPLGALTYVAWRRIDRWKRSERDRPVDLGGSGPASDRSARVATRTVSSLHRVGQRTDVGGVSE